MCPTSIPTRIHSEVSFSNFLMHILTKLLPAQRVGMDAGGETAVMATRRSACCTPDISIPFPNALVISYYSRMHK